jgi:predicted Fe-Mo cluster-binding NifX family protein
MTIAISATKPTFDAEVEPRFGRCPYFVIVDPETMQYEAIENVSAAASGGAGISAAQMIAEKGVEAIITGNCGPNAFQVLSTAGIKIFTGNRGKIRDAIQSYKSGQLQATSYPTVRGHHAGTGKGMGSYTRASVTSGVTPVSSPEDPAAELSSVRAELQKLNDKLIEVQCRLEMLEKK